MVRLSDRIGATTPAPNPFRVLADLLSDALDAYTRRWTKEGRQFRYLEGEESERVVSHFGPWFDTRDDARRLAARANIPFAAYDPVLTDADERFREVYCAIVMGVPNFSLMLMGRREPRARPLEDGNTYGRLLDLAASTDVAWEQSGSFRPAGAADGPLVPSHRTVEAMPSDCATAPTTSATPADQQPPPPEPLHEVQVKILKALDGKAMRRAELIGEAADGMDPSQFRRHYLKPLMRADRVRHSTRAGYYRPNATPPGWSE